MMAPSDEPVKVTNTLMRRAGHRDCAKGQLSAGAHGGEHLPGDDSDQ